mgnify:CR=1 FL=1|jgi:hypothetical protein
MKILWFDDIEVWNQPVFDMPFIGRVSIRQMCIIGIALILTFSSRDIFVTIISLSIALLFSMYRYRSLSLDELLYNLIIYMTIYKIYPLVRYITLLLYDQLSYIQQSNMMNITIISNIKKNMLNRYKQTYEKDNYNNKQEILIVNREPIRLKLRLVNKDGLALAGKLATIYLDDDHIASIVSDSKGEVETLISFKSDVHKVNHYNAKGDTRMLKVIVDGRLVFTQVITIKYIHDKLALSK